MSLVGPRPSLENQYLLVEKRNSLGILKIKPGITGLAQTQGRLDLSLQERLYWDLDYVKKYNLVLDLKMQDGIENPNSVSQFC